AQSEQFQAAAEGIAAATDIEQGAGQRCRYAGRYQQAGKYAECSCTQQGAALETLTQTLQRTVDGGRQAQFDKAQAGGAEQGEEDGEWHQYPGRLQACLQVELGAEQAHQRAED